MWPPEAATKGNGGRGRRSEGNGLVGIEQIGLIVIVVLVFKIGMDQLYQWQLIAAPDPIGHVVE